MGDSNMRAELGEGEYNKLDRLEGSGAEGETCKEVEGSECDDYGVGTQYLMWKKRTLKTQVHFIARE